MQIRYTTFPLLAYLLMQTTCLQAQPTEAFQRAYMTARDMRTGESSNITIKNLANQDVAVYGLFISSVDLNDCSACYGSVVAGDNLGGAVLAPITLKKNQSAPLGKNYLYNMLYNEIYFIKNTAGSSPCALPGCSWPGDAPNVHGWCITLNAVSRHSNYTFSNYTTGGNPSANSPAYSEAGNSAPYNYKYDLIDPSTLGNGNPCLGPIVCNDKTLTCSVSTAQQQSFQAYN